ncbi:hypothetical protein CCP2SC5_300026 [Azospirillaceae bacterium]
MKIKNFSIILKHSVSILVKNSERLKSARNDKLKNSGYRKKHIASFRIERDPETDKVMEKCAETKNDGVALVVERAES